MLYFPLSATKDKMDMSFLRPTRRGRFQVQMAITVSGLEKISILAAQAMQLIQDGILMHFRFLDMAMAALPFKERAGSGCIATDGRFCYYDPVYALRRYRQDPRLLTRIYLHMLLHCIFAHSFPRKEWDQKRWDLAADLAVENVILELGSDEVFLETDGLAGKTGKALQAKSGALTAEKLYRYFEENTLSPEEERKLRNLYCRDNHDLWKEKQAQSLEMTAEQWQKIARRVKTDLSAFSRSKSGGESLRKNLAEATREHYDYSQILQRFMVSGEEMMVSQEEFDLVYYTYGLTRYGNLPLIEPLEYRESRKVKEVAIVLDTSASCRGSAVEAFLRRTWSILKGGENFFHTFNIHIIQCDHQVQSDTKLTCEEDMKAFFREGKLTGFGATDFRPAFAYVEKLQERKEFENLKGLIYFTDGYGIYPERMPGYQVIFAFLEEDENRPPVPSWSMKVVL